MFRLAEQICSDPSRVIICIGNHKNFGRSGDHINANFPKDSPLGCSDESIAGAGDFIDGGDGIRAIGQCGDGLRTSDAVDFIHAGDMSS